MGGAMKKRKADVPGYQAAEIFTRDGAQLLLPASEIDALEAAGKKMGTDGDVIVISFDAVKDALTVMQDEKIMADFECNPLTAPLVEQTIRHMENGEEVDKVQYVEEGYFDYTMDLKSILKDRSY